MDMQAKQVDAQIKQKSAEMDMTVKAQQAQMTLETKQRELDLRRPIYRRSWRWCRTS